MVFPWKTRFKGNLRKNSFIFFQFNTLRGFPGCLFRISWFPLYLDSNFSDNRGIQISRKIAEIQCFAV